ncbi:MAG: transglutaminase family protein [Methylobacteriaceae bacterium]|nr:transglutaminase family protein [Methylobacteriaceae bacterium]MBV9702704.1 transglutaminase family protein [Methylobacteriaceae bacterium]
MIYDVSQLTAFDYAATVPFAQHVLRLTPVDRNGQSVLSMRIDIDPEPIERVERTDFFGNRLIHIDIAAPHRRLEIKSAARVRVEPAIPFLAELTPRWEDVCASALASVDLAAASPVHFVFPSRLVSPSAAIRDYAAASFPPDRPALAGATDLMRRIHADFTYAPGSTDVRTLPDEAFRQRRGVCQDFAHVMIAGLRGLGLPAAYVSGYLRTYPPPGRKRLTGADATHAWVAVWCGQEAGWRGLDPTNAVLAGEDHIALAIGRDYADVPPVNGIIVSSDEQELHIGVDVVPVETDRARRRGR